MSGGGHASGTLTATGLSSEVDDASIFDSEPGITEDADFRHLRAALKQHALGDNSHKLAYVLDNHIYSSRDKNSTERLISGLM